jgi:hypothetical protein
MQSNLKEKERMSVSEMHEEKKIRDQILRDETQNYINDVDETLSSMNQINQF